MSGGDRVTPALRELAAGRMVVVADDEQRENEGDLICAAELATAQTLAFIVRHGTGLVCVALAPERADALELPRMVAEPDDPRGTAFTTTVDLKPGTTTGVSAADRAATIRALADPHTAPGDLSRPGHVLPLRADRDGVLGRRGHTEAAADLCRLAGLSPAGVLCEITNDDGTMTRGADLERFATEHGLLMLTVAELVAHRARAERLVRRAAETRLPTRHGDSPRSPTATSATDTSTSRSCSATSPTPPPVSRYSSASIRNASPARSSAPSAATAPTSSSTR